MKSRAAALRQQVFDIAVAQVEAIVEPNGAADDFRRESVAFLCAYPEVVSQERLIWQYRAKR
jgi:hypothetical protein